MTTRSLFGGSLLAVFLSSYAAQARAVERGQKGSAEAGSAFGADAEALEPVSESGRRDELPPWSFRLGVGGGAPIPGLHEQILSAEGYQGPRWSFALTVERRLSSHFGLGAMARYQFRALEPSLPDGAMELGFHGPRYSERSWIFAVDAPLTFLISQRAHGRATELCLAPWLGAGAGTLELHDEPAWRPGFAWGGELRLLWHGGRVAGGFTAGAYSFRIAQPGSLEGPVDLGMILVSAMGGFDVG